MVSVLVPVKALSMAKERLAPVLYSRERSALVMAMLADVLSVLTEHPIIDSIYVVSPDFRVRDIACERGAIWSDERYLNAIGLNQIVQAAISHLNRRDADHVLIIHGDVPMITAGELTQIIESHYSAGANSITLVPDRHGRGTNGIMINAQQSFPFSFGIDSYPRHLQTANRHGLATRSCFLAGAGLDIDTPSDLHELIRRMPSMGSKRTRTTLRFLIDNHIARLLRHGDDRDWTSVRELVNT